MTATTGTPSPSPAADTFETFERTVAQHHPRRWRLSRAGFVNVWHYYDTTFEAAGGRFILRGTNGSGKSRALEMLLPFLLDADRRNMGAGTAVKMEDLMTAGAADQSIRLGYMWLELRRDDSDSGGDSDDSGTDAGAASWLTVGAAVKFAFSTKEATVSYFTTPLRIGHELALVGEGREPLSRRELGEIIGDDRITTSPERHRERVRAEVFGLTGELGKDRFDGLVKLLHTLRSPDVGNRIEEGKLPVILADALPPLSDTALTEAGAQLDGLTSTRADQERLEANLALVKTFHGTYRSYLSAVLADTLDKVRSGADGLDQAVAAHRRARDLADTLEAERVRVDTDQANAAARADELRAELDALRNSAAYRNARELLERAATVQSKASHADLALRAAEHARAAERSRAGEADRAAGDVLTDAATVDDALRRAREALADIRLTTHDLPATVGAQRSTPGAETAVVRTDRGSALATVTRPTADTVHLDTDLAALDTALTAARRAADSRRTQAGERRRDADALDRLAQKVTSVQQAADRDQRTAEEDAGTADRRAADRDRAALALAAAWLAWIDAVDSLELGDLDPGIDPAGHPVLALLRDHSDLLCGPGDEIMLADPDGQTEPTVVDPLTSLDGAAAEVTAAAYDAVGTRLAELDQADRHDADTAGALGAERAELAAARDPSPALPPWQRDTAGVPLWRCLDFTGAVPDADRAGIEAALSATGLLTATVDATGQVVATDGQVLLTAAPGAPSIAPGDALAAALTVDPAGASSAALAAAVSAVLTRVRLTDNVDARDAVVPQDAPCIGRDGSWRHGPLRGRHRVAAARHIGAAARAAARAERIAEIDRELETLRAAAAARTHRREQLTARRRDITAAVRKAPTSRALVSARATAAGAEAAAAKAAARARESRQRADALAQQHGQEQREHRARCEQFDLPHDAPALAAVETAAAAAGGNCQRAAAAVSTLQAAVGRHGGHLAKLRELTESRAGDEAAATAAWEDWHRLERELDTLRKTVGAAADEVRRRVRDADAERTTADESARKLGERLRALDGQCGQASARAEAAETDVRTARRALAGAVTHLLDQLAEPSVATTAVKDAGLLDGRFTDASASAVRADAATLAAALRRARADQTQLLRARAEFERDVTAYDVNATLAPSGVWLFDLTDNDGRRPLADAVTELTDKVEHGKAALSQREQDVFTRFILGEVGEELRARIDQAADLVNAMNDSLRNIRTSHNIGVRLSWSLAEDAPGDVARIKALIARAAAMRNEADDRDLIALLTARVQAEATVNPTDGYAANLRAALDYRTWHQIEVSITGPEPDRTRRLSRRAKLSQGETRFVSYVTLFAAADAYLSGLDDDKALRLILLDDAFAKVDEPTIAELLGLLVRLDLDFVMTGHALYGCYPQVPALDVYEICRDERGGPAATAHIHWDGRTRHLRAT